MKFPWLHPLIGLISGLGASVLAMQGGDVMTAQDPTGLPFAFQKIIGGIIGLVTIYMYFSHHTAIQTTEPTQAKPVAETQPAQ